MNKRNKEKRFVLSICLLNLSGLGLGYVWLQDWLRFAIDLIILFVFVFLFFSYDFDNRAIIPISIFMTFDLISVFDGWLQAKKKVDHYPKIIVNKANRLIGIAIFVIILEILGLVMYQSIGENLFRKGKEQYESYNFTEASLNLNKLIKYYNLAFNIDIQSAKNIFSESSQLSVAEKAFKDKDYQVAAIRYEEFKQWFPDSKLINEIYKRIALTNKELAEKYISEEKYSEGIEKYLIFINYSTLNIEKEKLQEEINSSLLRWARLSINENKYQAGIEKYKYVINKLGVGKEKDTITEELANVYMQNAITLGKKGDFENAIKNYEILENEYKNSKAYTNLKNPIQNAYIEWGILLRSQKQYIKSLEKFDFITSNNKIKDILTRARVERKTTLEMFSKDSGEESKNEINNALALACNKKSVKSEIINYLNKESGKALACGDISIPYGLNAIIPGTFRYVVFRENASKTIQTCSYNGGHVLKREQYYSIITVNNVQTGKKVTSITVYGSVPINCEQIHSFQIGSFTDYEYGGAVADEKINEWLIKVIK